MIRIILTIIFLTTFWTTYSQKIAITYYDSAWLLTTKNLGKYFRIGIIDTIKYQYYGEVKDYYMNGKLQMKGKFNANIKVDTFYFYYPSGNIMSKGTYENNIRYGIWTNYYGNGKVKDKVVFNGDFICALEYYDENGTPKMLNGTGEWETEYLSNSNYIISVKGSYLDTLRNGTWTYHTRSLKELIRGMSMDKRLECTEIYKDGKFVKGKYYSPFSGAQNVNSSIYDILEESDKFVKIENWKLNSNLTVDSYPYLKFLPKRDTSILKKHNAETTPKFEGGVAKFYEFIYKELKCFNNGSDSKISVDFVIDSTGYLRKGSVIIVKGNIAESCKVRLIKILENSPKWTPARITEIDKDVPTKMNIQIKLD